MNKNITTSALFALVLSACASGPQPNAALESAKSAVRTAEADPNVARYAALDLEAAKNQLAIAEAAATHHQDPAIAQPAYLAAQNARLAQSRAAAKADDARVAAGQVERDQIRLAARTREVDTAKQATQAANQATQTANQATQAANQATQAATEQNARLQAEMEQMKAAQTPRGIVLTLGDVLFDTGKAVLNPGAKRKLDQLAQFLSEHPTRRVQIDGFTDTVGSDSYNLDLSQRRADAVKDSLLSRGIASPRIGTQGYGKAYPVAGNSDAGGRQLNRRVEVVIGEENNAQIIPRS